MDEFFHYLLTDPFLRGAIFTILIVIGGYLISIRKTHKDYYKIIWKKSSHLKPKDILRDRAKKEFGFKSYHYPRLQEKSIKEKIEKGENVIVTGNPLAGKTRSVYQVLKQLKRYDVISPKIVDIDTGNFRVPCRLTFWRKKILILDDLNKFVGKQNFEYLISEFSKRKIPIIATCRSGPEYEQIWKKLEEKLSLTFGDPIEIPKVSREEGEKIAKETGKDKLPESFDGTIGSIFLPLDAMRERFKSLQPEEKGILLSLKRLHLAGIYRERDIYSTERVKLVCQKKEGIEGKPYQWQEWLKNLEKNGFIEFMGDEECRVEEAYLERVVEEEIDPAKNLKEMISIFANDPEALFSIGLRAYSVGEILKSAEYLKLAISAYEKALEVFTIEKYPYYYATTQNNLGNAYRTLAEVENKKENCIKAITAYNQALKICTLQKYPYEYAATQNNLGTAYWTLAKAEDKKGNCIKAINAYNQVLKVFTLQKYPYEYARTQNNLGNAYGTLAEVEDKKENCIKAIKAFTEALKVYTLEKFPYDYAATQNNLGTAYWTLAKAEDKKGNCKKAIKAYHKALKVYTLKKYPYDYAATQNNLGTAYLTLAEIENTEENCTKAINALTEALKVHTLEKFPYDYARAQYNLGNAYLTLATVEDKRENCRKAINAYNEALKVHTLEKFSYSYARAQNNLGNAYRTLAEVEDKRKNCRRAYKAYKEALETCKRLSLTGLQQIAEHNINLLFQFCKGELDLPG